MKRIVDDIAALRPSLFVGVPRVFDRIYAGVMEQITKAGEGSSNYPRASVWEMMLSTQVLSLWTQVCLLSGLQGPVVQGSEESLALLQEG